MGKKGTTKPRRQSKDPSKSQKDGEVKTPQVIAIAERGIKTSADFREFMAASMCDLVLGLVDPRRANAATAAGGKLLQMVSLELKHGRIVDENGNREIQMVPAISG